MTEVTDQSDLVVNPEQEREITYIEAADQPDSFRLTLPQSVALNGIFAATRGHIKEHRGIELSDDDLRNPKGGDTVMFARLLMLNLVSRINQIDESQIAKEFGYKNESAVLEGIDKSYSVADDEIVSRHMNSLRYRYRIILRTWATGKPEENNNSGSNFDLDIETVEEPIVDPKIAKAIDLFKKDDNPDALEILYDKYSVIIDDVLDQFDEVPGWLSDEAYEIFKQIFQAVDFSSVTDIAALLREGLTSGLEDTIESRKKLRN